MLSFSTQQLRTIATFSYFGLGIWFCLWQFVLSNDPWSSNTLTILFFMLPWLAPMVGIVKGKPYTFAWANFIVMIFLLHGFTAIYTHQDQALYVIIELVLALTMFLSGSMYARKRGRELGLGLKKAKEQEQ